MLIKIFFTTQYKLECDKYFTFIFNRSHVGFAAILTLNIYIPSSHNQKFMPLLKDMVHYWKIMFNSNFDWIVIFCLVNMAIFYKSKRILM